MTENTAIMSHGGSYIPCRFSEVIHPAEKDERTGDEIAFDVIQKAGLEVDLSEFI